MYAVYHGPEGIRAIAEQVHRHTARLAEALERLGLRLEHPTFFDTLAVELDAPEAATRVHDAARAARINFRALSPTRIGVALDETVTDADLEDLIACFAAAGPPARPPLRPSEFPSGRPAGIPHALRRSSPYLTHPVFHRHRSETEMLRYIRRLEARDLSLTSAMIPLGSCTMKLNATTEMAPVSWPAFAALHPFAPSAQAEGYRRSEEH